MRLQVLRPEEACRRLSEMWREAACTEDVESGAAGKENRPLGVRPIPLTEMR